MDDNDDIINAVSRRTFVGTMAAAAGIADRAAARAGRHRVTWRRATR